MRPWIALAVAGCAAQATPQKDVTLPRTPVRLVRAKAARAPRWVAGTVEGSSHAFVSTRISAAVEEVRVREGDRVAQGDLLVRLGAADLRAQLAAARTSLESARSAERRTRMLAQGGHSPVSAVDVAQAQRAEAEAQVARAAESLSYARVRAPFAGVVLAKLVARGDLVAPGQPMIELSGGAQEIVAQVAEAEARSVAIGARVPFATTGARGDAVVVALSPGGDPLSHRGVLRARIDGQVVRSGEFARIALPAPDDAERIWVPRTAVVARGDLTGVVLAADGHAELRWISAGDSAADAVSVRAGLSEGERVIDSPGALRDGDPVEVVDGR
jgi:RND family efflux transporter MFP subunit